MIEPKIMVEQKVITVGRYDDQVNEVIANQNKDGWLVSYLTINGDDITILFTRTKM